MQCLNILLYLPCEFADKLNTNKKNSFGTVAGLGFSTVLALEMAIPIFLLGVAMNYLLK